jgi:hypothetical protein
LAGGNPPGGGGKVSGAFLGRVRINIKAVNGSFNRIKFGLGVVLMTALSGCVGYVDGGYGGTVIVPGPDVYFWGGDYDRGHAVREYSHRGFESRAVAHSSGGRHVSRPAPGRPGTSSSSHSGGGGHGGRQ